MKKRAPGDRITPDAPTVVDVSLPPAAAAFAAMSHVDRANHLAALATSLAAGTASVDQLLVAVRAVALASQVEWSAPPAAPVVDPPADYDAARLTRAELAALTYLLAKAQGQDVRVDGDDVVRPPGYVEAGALVRAALALEDAWDEPQHRAGRYAPAGWSPASTRAVVVDVPVRAEAAVRMIESHATEVVDDAE